MKRIETDFTKMMNIDIPLIAAPMFLVSNEDLVVAVSEAGGIGTFPALNYRPLEEYKKALVSIKKRTSKPIGVNIITNKSNTRQNEDLKIALENGVELFITSLGSPETVIKEAHKQGAKVFCDVTNLQHAIKVQDLGADGVIAVGSGAGGHAGPISPLVLVRWLKEKLKIPVIAAGGIAGGYQMASMLALGAAAVSVGTRFIASKEAQIEENYKKAVIDATPEDIMMTSRISGTPAAVIRTPYIEKLGPDLHPIIKFLKDSPYTKKWTKSWLTPFIHYTGMKALEKAATELTWKSVWSAGQSVGLIHEILTAKEILEKFEREYFDAISKLP